MASVTTELTTIAGNLTTMLGGVAPVALGVFAVFLAWRLGKGFFSSLAK